MHETLQELFECILAGNHRDAERIVDRALREGLLPQEILEYGLIAPMSEVGDLFEQCELFVPEMILAARAMKSGLGVLRPHLAELAGSGRGTLVIGTVSGDLHDIGKNLVAMMFEGAGYKVVDLGTNVSAQSFSDAVRLQAPCVVAMSALLTTTMLNMGSCVEAIASSGLRDKVRILVGGAPVTQGFAVEIGADGYAPDASRAVKVAQTLQNL
jgi:5-methyltetrahydrofolate--homocysteine methyltransferase